MKKCVKIAAVVLALSSALPCAAGGKEGGGAAWKTGVEISREDNLFHLSPAQIASKALNKAGDQVNGRFTGMAEVGDTALTVSPEVTLPAGRKASFRLSAEGRRYLGNPKKSSVALKAGYERKLSGAGAARLGLKYIPGEFQKNYLVGGTPDPTGKVTRDQQLWKEGHFSEWEVSAGYRHKLLGRKSGLGLEAGAAAAYCARRYAAAELRSRDDKKLKGTLSLDAEPSKRLAFGLYGSYERSKSPVSRDVLLLDEPVFGLDFNADGDKLDNNIRTVQSVDRSLNAAAAGLKAAWQASRRLELEAGYEREKKTYTSSQPLDPSDKDRVDRKHTLSAAVSLKLSGAAKARLGFVYEGQKTDKAGDPASAGEVTGYIDRTWSAGVTLRF